jgi:hypothetical protein
MTNNTMPDIEAVLMRRVRTVHALRPFFSAAALSALLVLLSLWGIGREVWVAKVFENAPHGSLVSAARFFLDALLGTRLVVQALVALALAATVYLAREAARLLVRPAFAG